LREELLCGLAAFNAAGAQKSAIMSLYLFGLQKKAIFEEMGCKALVA